MVRVGSVRVVVLTDDTADVADDVSMTWTRADVDVLAWLLTWSDDVIQMTSDDISSRFPASGRRVTE